MKSSSPTKTAANPLTAASPPTAASPSTAASALDHLLRKGWLKQDQIWRASHQTRNLSNQDHFAGIPSGYDQLDALLVNRGWPARGLTEILHDQTGLGELRLLMPALRSLSQNQNRWIIWVSPPYIPYAPALANAGINLKKLLVVNPKQAQDKLWALEKAMASSSCSAVLAWPDRIEYKQLRRLQVASKSGDCLGVLYRPSSALKQASPAELRIKLQNHQDDSALSDQSLVSLQILKRKGGWATEPFQLALQDKLNQLTPEFNELYVPQWQNPQQDLIYMEQFAGDQHVLS